MDDLLEIRDLRVWFPVRKGVFSRTTGYVKAVDGVSFSLRRGETLGVVGESGSGKSTIARVVAGLQRPTGGEVTLRGSVGMVFQDPLGSLNPRMTVRSALDEVPGGADAARLLEMVGLDASALDKYPHEFSGGQRQRICIARAIAASPDLLVCDEAVSALDLAIRSQVLDLLSDLKARLGLSLLFITHDIGVVQHVSDRVIVMHRGRIVESGDCAEVIRSPRAEYTRYLIASVPRIGKPLEDA
ncbi:MAG: ABC transporter ATP-binding protein [Kiritimatiellae bacterium]|nr:ABC transporter ATP-binding protein [Kiritimatiellia bacterium]